jgi:protein-disulfide isomerase
LAAGAVWAADDTLARLDAARATGGSHEVVWTPPTAVPVRGPRFAAVTIDVYVEIGNTMSYTAAEVARRAVQRAGDVRVVLHLTARPANDAVLEALLEANAQGRFFALFDRIVQNRLFTGERTVNTDLGRLGREALLDGARLDRALATRAHKADVDRMQRQTRASGHHAPELLINGRRQSPYSGDEAIGRAIGEARDRADQLLAEGVPLSQLYERLLELDEEVPFVIDPVARTVRRRLSVSLTGAPMRGPAMAPITVVVWGNFACMQCADVAASLKRLDQARPGMVRLVWKHFLPYRISAAPAAEYAAAAQAQGRFWGLHDLIMSSHLTPARITKAELDRLASAAGLDEGRLRAEIDSGRARAAVERDTEEARRLGVPTPASVTINGLPVAGAPSFELLDRIVAAELDAGLLERLRVGPTPPSGARSTPPPAFERRRP